MKPFVVTQIRARELADRLARGEPVFLLDVRQPWEHETCALAASTLIPLPELHERARDELEVPEGALLVAYCHHGVRSLSAAAILEQCGFARVASLAGGIDAWSREVDPRVPRY